MKIGVLGAGAWGMALANLLCKKGHNLLLWEYNPTLYKRLSEEYAASPLANKPKFTTSFEDFAAFEAEVLILATPSQFLRKTLLKIPAANFDAIFTYSGLQAIVNVAKGIEEGSLKTIDEILSEILPPAAAQKLVALSGPSHAEEVAKALPTTVVIAGEDEKQLVMLQELFSTDYFRVYRSKDILGVEIGGAVKNIIAIAAGIVAGLGFGDNTMGALLSRGIVEISRFGMALGAEAETFMGLSGIGDLITTAISPHSRNRHVGYEIGRGKKLKEIIASMEQVAEGVATTRSVYLLAKKQGVEMPIVEQVFYVLYEDKDPAVAIKELMQRELKKE